MTGRATAAAGGVTWLVQDRSDLPASHGWLTADERARLAGLRIAKRRDDFLLGRWTGKLAIAARLVPAAALDAIAIRAASDGAPEAFLDGVPLPFTVSLSHSAGRALAAVGDAGRALGADLEHVEPRSALLVGDFFTAAEAAQVAACPPAWRDHVITVVWSAKESVLKARRTGLREDPRHIDIQLGELLPVAACDGWHRLTAIDGDHRALCGWWRDDGDHVLSLAGDALATPPGVAARPDRRSDHSSTGPG